VNDSNRHEHHTTSGETTAATGVAQAYVNGNGHSTAADLALLAQERVLTFEAVPAELRALKQWVCYRKELRRGTRGKPDYYTKVPYNARTGAKASSTRASSWSSFDEAVRAYEDAANGYDGIGFVFTADDPLAGVDLDHAYDPATKTFKPWAQPLLAALTTYAEFSPSGEGVHLIGRAVVGAGRSAVYADGKIEVYDRARYFTISGRRVSGSPTTINEITVALVTLQETVWGREKAKDGAGDGAGAGKGQRQGVKLDERDRKLLGKIINSKGGEVFLALWTGQPTSANPNASDDDAALVAKLAFWLNRDAARMDRWFRQSGRMRDKWNAIHHGGTETYGAHLIHIAITEWVKEGEGFAGEGDDGDSFTAGGNAGFNWRDHDQLAHDLLNKQIAAKPHLVDGLIPTGFAQLAARPKSGKSAFATQTSLAVASEDGTVLDREVVHGRVLHLALEDTEGRMQDRIRRMLGFEFNEIGQYVRAPCPQRLHIFYRWPTFDKGGLACLDDFVAAHPDTALIVADSLGVFRGPVPRGGGYDIDYAFSHALSEWVNRHQINLIGIAHTSKRRATDDPDNSALDLVQNTTGITAGADTVVVMVRVDGVMTMYPTGRDLEQTDPLKLKMDSVTLCWQINDGEAEVTASAAILEALGYLEEPAKVQFLADYTGKPQRAIRTACWRLLHDDTPLIGLSRSGYYLLSRGPSNQKPREDEHAK